MALRAQHHINNNFFIRVPSYIFIYNAKLMIENKKYMYFFYISIFVFLVGHQQDHNYIIKPCCSNV